MMTEIEFTVEPIELAIEDFFEYHDFDSIHKTPRMVTCVGSSAQ